MDRVEQTKNFRPFVKQLVVVLRDVRVWAIVLPILAASALSLSFLGPRTGAVLTLGLGLVGSYLINQIDKLPVPADAATFERLYDRILLPAVAGIFVASSSDIFVRVWLTPWHWFHARSDVPSCWFLMCGVAWDWFGVLVCGAVIALLTGPRATFAAMIGIAIWLPLTLTDMYTGTEQTLKNLTIFASSCKFLSDFTAENLGSFSEGATFGLLSRALLLVYAARVVSSWRASASSTNPFPK